MKTCEKCEKDFKPKGRQKVCDACKAPKPQRPIDRFRTNRFVFGGGAVMMRR